MLKPLPSFVCKLLFALSVLSSNAVAQPKIGSFIPASGPVGTAVTITGAGFNATAAGNIVYFGAVRAMVTSASASSLTVTVPAGATYEPISVLNTATGLTGYSSQPFVVSFASPYGTDIPGNFFQQPVNFTADYAPTIVAISDLDGDGKPDMIVGSFSSVSILRNVTAAGSINAASFADKINLPSSSNSSPTSVNPTAIVVKDVDGDGKPDIAAVSSFNNQVIIWRNISTVGSINASSFAAPVAFTITSVFSPNAPASLAIGDLDGDGKPELVVTKGSTFQGSFNQVSVFRNTSTPGSITSSSFAPKVDFTTANSPNAVAVSDVDGDGRPDLVTANQDPDDSSPGSLSVLRNTAVAGSIDAGSFAAHVDFAAGNHPFTIAASDIDGDGKPDLIASSTLLGSISVLRNTAAAGSINGTSFAPEVRFPSGGIRTIAVGDANGDGKPDIVASAINLVNILRNTASSGSIDASSFAPVTGFISNFGSSLALGDLDGDGIPEVVGTTLSSISVAVLKVNAPSPNAVPQITSFSPVSGPAGTVVTINGSGFFTDVPQYNSVFFGAALANVISATSTSMTVVVPAGATYQPIALVTPASLTAYSAKPFDITYSNPYGTGIPYNFYKPKVTFSTGTLPYFVALSDLDHDGRTDMVVANASANTISILVNVSTTSLGVTSFSSRIDIPVGQDPRSIAIGDLDGNGKADIVVANAGSSTLTVLRNSTSPGNISASSFEQRADFPTGAQPFSVAINDIDLDGKPDLISANLAAGTVSVLRNIGQNGAIYPTSFAAKTDFAAGAFPRSLAVSDLDGDGKPDLAVTNEHSATVSVLRNTAVTGFINMASMAPVVNFVTGSNPNCVAASDIDNDGKPDLVVVNYGSNTVSVLRNMSVTGNFTPLSFASKVDFATGLQPFFAAVGDVDGDGKPDIAVVNAASTNLSVLRNTSAIHDINASTFAPKADFAAGNYPVSIAIGDLDGNGIAELAVADAATNTLGILPINSPQAIAIASVSPVSGPVGSTVTITGNGFDPTYFLNQVFFGAVRAEVTGGNSTALQVKVPAGATYAPISVSVNTTELAAYSPLSFDARFTNPFGSGIPAGFYRPKVDYPVLGPVTYGVAFGDVNQDGKPDLISINQKTNTLSVMRNISAAGSITPGSFGAPVNFATPADPRAVAFVDVDGYAYKDVVVLNPAAGTISVFQGDYNYGNIDNLTFINNRKDFSTAGYASSFAVGDLDGDGRPELVVTNPYTDRITVLRNMSSHPGLPVVAFADPVSFRAGSFPRSVALGDVNGDGRLDIIVANEKGNSVSVLLNNAVSGNIGPASFGDKTDYAVGSNPPGVAVGDVDGDGKADIVVVNYGSNTVSVLRNTSPGGMVNTASFASRVDFATGVNPFSVALGDVDGDGKPDLVTANSGSDNISVLRNLSAIGNITAASFAGKADFGAGVYPLSLAIGDLDGDGLAEVATANAGGNGISVLRINAPSIQVAANTLNTPAAEPPAGMLVFPNPTRGAFTLQLGVKAPAASLEVLNESGTVIEKRTLTVGAKAASATLSISLLNQPAGVYYVKVTGVGGVQVMKVVVQR